MEQNAFRDYCKAENTDDEEDNIDLQSRLYAEVYYASNSVETIDTKPNVKLEFASVDQKQLATDTSIKAATTSNENYTETISKTNFNKSIAHVSTNNLQLIEYDESYVEHICNGNEIEQLNNIDSKSNISVPYIEPSIQCSEEKIELSKDNKQSLICHKVEVSDNNTNSDNTCNTSENLLIKSEIEEESKENLKHSLHSLDSEINTTQPHNLNSGKYIAENNKETLQEVESIKPESSDIDVLKKYEFSKLFINNLYLEKYKDLITRLQEIEEEKQKSLREIEQRKNLEKSKELEQAKSGNRYSAHQTEMDTRYNIVSKSTKHLNTSNDSEEITLLSSDSESDSEESILEVPIPPKPQPPVINLQDSDESSEISSSNYDTDQDCLSVVVNDDSVTQKIRKEQVATEKNIDTDLEINDSTTDRTSITEDIILNCTEVRKGASNIKEIMDMCKSIDSEKHSNDKLICQKSKIVTLNEMSNKNVSEPLTTMSVSDKYNASELHLSSNIRSKSNLVYERDKEKSVSFSEDTIMIDQNNSSELNLSRKRHCENDDSESSSAKQRKTQRNENKQSETGPKHQNNKEKNKDKHNSWEDYFFRPMSESVKAFYDKSPEQDNFDVEKIQSKMSKDPRLWAILDEDSMPRAMRQRFWNVKCNNCNREGHQKYNCPDPRKLPRCRMCGTEGHIESRCPQKMCLTCGKKQGIFKKTCEFCRTLYCNMCKAVGHKSTECPDLWRRFHQTTRNTEINIPDNLSEIMKPADLLYCCNCTKRGHDSSACNEFRWSPHFPTPAHVSNYTDGPHCKQPTPLSNTDIIPLRQSKRNVSRNVTFLQGKDDLQNCNIVYSYGTFYTRKPNGEEVETELSKFTITSMSSFLEGRILPSFLDLLTKIIKFEIKIYRNSRKVLIIRVRSVVGAAVHIYEFFEFWLQLVDEDKHLSIQTNFPRNTKKMQNFLLTKLHEVLNQDIPDPKIVIHEIEQLKASMSTLKDPKKLSFATKRLLDLRSIFIKIFIVKPKMDSYLYKLQKIIKSLKGCTSSEIHAAQYVEIITTYNRLFMPRQLSGKQIQRFLQKYYKREQRKQRLKEKERQKNMQQKMHDPYQKFINRLNNQHKGHTTQKFKNNKDNITSNSSKVTQKQSKHYAAAAECSSTISSIHLDQNIGTSSTDNVYFKSNTVTQLNNPYSMCTTQSSHNQDTPEIVSKQVNNQHVNVLTRSNSKIKSSNLISIPIQKHLNVPSNQVISTEFNSNMSYIDHNNSMEDIQKNIHNTETVKTPNKPDNNIISTEMNTSKKKKPKKGKKAIQDLDDSIQHGESQVANVDVTVENRAKKVIKDALQFKLPYMNSAAEEVQKRINDKNIKPEHIDVLQKLVNLEKDHQKHVTSFCSYLK